MKNKVSRRDFLAKTGIATAGVVVLPRHVLGGKGYIAPSDKLNIAAIGSGGMGAGNIGRVSSENIVALCDVDFERAAGTFKKFPKAKQYKDFRRMLDKEKSIDAVIVATPDQTHYQIIKDSLAADQHTITVKPLVLKYSEAIELEDLAKEKGFELAEYRPDWIKAYLEEITR